MDQFLKAHNLGSATARRRKMQQREIATQLDEERRTKILLYGYSSEEDESSDEEGNTYSPIPDTQSDHLRSTSSVSTVSKPTSIKSPTEQSTSFPLPSPARSKPYIPEVIIPPPLFPDFNFYPIEEVLHPDDEQRETPIEVATPILYSIPRDRPSMISIKTSISKTTLNSPNRPMSLPHPPPIPARSERRASATNLSSVSSPIQRPVISLPLLSGQVYNNDRAVENDVFRRRPVTISMKSESALSYQVPSYDIFPRRSKIASSRQIDRPTIREEPARKAALPPQIVVNARRTSSFPTVPKEPESKPTASPPRELHNRKSTSTLRQRRSSIGLALRNASSSLRGKTANTRPTTSGSGGSMSSHDGIDFSAFPMPPPSPLYQQSFQQQTKILSTPSSESSRLSRVRTTIGL
jgi:hypothetical protein